MNVKLAELKKADPKLAHSDAFKKAFDAWKVSSALRSLDAPLVHADIHLVCRRNRRAKQSEGCLA